ncbi:MAG: 23S rRNA (adenine(2503)-C(2))-methyltransferase RlmN [Pelagibacteraceae bacterium]|nr:23S rRNA (adenine(2503)-C(2))-methyltransferase RlmN [Pelagibacteraceae bacterium]
MYEQNFYNLEYNELKKHLSEFNLSEKAASMRANQIWKFVYKKGVGNPDNFINLPLELINKIKTKIDFNKISIEEKKASRDGTIKWLFKLNDGNLIETVYIPFGKTGTLCVSSQVGCTLNCKFCHTGTQMIVKNLETTEIIQQVLLAKDELTDWSKEKKIRNIVYMGMGEPLYNFNNVKKSIEILKNVDGLEFGPKRITISTAGIVPEILSASKEIKTCLAVSLHAPTDEIREKIMPINKKYKLKALIDSCRKYAEMNKEKIFLEYVLLKDINDTKYCAQKLIKLMGGFPCKLNLIEFNVWPGAGFEPSSKEKVSEFYNTIKESGHVVTLRKSKGNDILGACGQLKTESKKISKKLDN